MADQTEIDFKIFKLVEMCGLITIVRTWERREGDGGEKESVGAEMEFKCE